MIADITHSYMEVTVHAISSVIKDMFYLNDKLFVSFVITSYIYKLCNIQKRRKNINALVYAIYIVNIYRVHTSGSRRRGLRVLKTSHGGNSEIGILCSLFGMIKSI